MIIDAFIFFNELDLLEARLKYLYDTVDYFVIVESNISHSGNPKKFHYLENKDKFKKYEDKIIWSPFVFNQADHDITFDENVDKTNYNSPYWYIEKSQRNQIATAIKDFPEDSFVIISDLDEIPNKDAINFIKNNLIDGIESAVCIQQLFYYNLTNLSLNPWPGSIITTIRQINSRGVQWLRDNRWDNNIIPHVNNGGWHFSYFGDIPTIITKIENTAHQEVNIEKFKDIKHITESITNHTDLFDRPNEQCITVDLTIFPSELLNAMTSFLPLNSFDEWLNNVPSTWREHKEFSQWLVKTLIADTVVELGIDQGFSTFCFADARDTNVFGIDSVQTTHLQEIKNLYKFDNIEFINGQCNEVAESWDTKIDILHINGSHTYETVKSNFNTWKKFLKDHSVILFNNITSDAENTGKFFNELHLFKTKFNSADGLGVASKNKAIIDLINNKFNLISPTENQYLHDVGMDSQKMSLVIPTMWRYPTFLDFISQIVDLPVIDEIIIINNDISKTPTNNVLTHHKVKMHNFEKNTFVNPAWNYGVKHSRNQQICILNDDIFFDPTLFYKVNKFLTPGTVLGLSSGIGGIGQTVLSSGTIDFEKFTGQAAYGFGCLMCICKSDWIDIPDGLDIYYGDNWIFDTMVWRFNNNYLITNMHFYTPYASTTITLPNMEDISSKEQDIYKMNIEIFKDDAIKARNGYILAYEFEQHCNTQSDINEHLTFMRELSLNCKHVTEMGVSTGCSSRAFLVNNLTLRSYDVKLNDSVEYLFALGRSLGRDVQYIKADVLKLEIDETDLLFIDTWHQYSQLKKELQLHHSKVKKYIVMHDTHTFGTISEGNSDNIGLMPAIIEFLIEHPEWKIHTHRFNNNGLTVLERITTTYTQSPKPNIIIGTACGYQVADIRNFVCSFRKYNKVDQILLVVDSEISQEHIDFFSQYNVKFEFFETRKFINTWVHTSRCIKILELLSGNASYNNVFLSDVRDVVFQNNPFNELPDDFLYFFQEDAGITIGMNEYNSAWIYETYEKDMLTTMQHRAIICSGTILGSQNNIIKLLKLMKDELLKIRSKDAHKFSIMPFDQTITNYIAHTVDDGYLNFKLKANGDIVGTIGLSCTDARAKDIVTVVDNKVFVNNHCPSVVHQYDRNQQLLDFFNNEYV